MNPLINLWMGIAPLAAAAPDDAGGSSGDQLWRMLMFLVPMFVILYFLMIRPQRKRQRERVDMLGALKKGDKIITRGGIHAIVTTVRDRDVVVRIDDNCKVTLSKAGVARVLPPEEGGDKK